MSKSDLKEMIKLWAYSYVTLGGLVEAITSFC